MKHTMKKLLCMALAIMLLVSAVPVFAAAESSVNVPVDVYINGSMVSTKNLEVGVSGRTLNGDLAMSLLDNKEYRTYDHWASNSSGDLSDGATIVNDTWLDGEMNKVGGYRLSVYFNETLPSATHRDVTVHIYYADGQLKDNTSFTVDVGGIQLTKAFGKTLAGSDVEKWAYNNTTVTDTYYTRDNCPGTLYLYLVANSTSEEPTAPSTSTTPSSPATTAAYVSVILSTKTSGFVAGDYINCNLVSGKITPTDRNTVAAAISSKGLNIVGWKRADNGQQASSLVDFDFAGLAEPINILPIFGASNNGNGNGNTVTTPTTGKLSLVIRVNGTKKYDNDVKNFTNATVANVIKNIYDSDWTSKYAFDKVEVNGVTYGRSDLEVRAGDDVDIYLTRKYSKDNSNKVYLHVYLNGDASTIAMTKDITGTYLMDDWKTDTTEILKYLKNNYYTAKDSSNAITIDGLYVSTDTKGAFPSNYYADNKTTSKDNINDLLEDGYVHISVMLKNAKAKSSSTADSSNPKTGDTIFVPVMVMGVTATALAAAYVFGKKRFAR